jgi:hypothetical protein
LRAAYVVLELIEMRTTLLKSQALRDIVLIQRCAWPAKFHAGNACETVTRDAEGDELDGGFL